jgi:hypothetical protein
MDSASGRGGAGGAYVEGAGVRQANVEETRQRLVTPARELVCDER